MRHHHSKRRRPRLHRLPLALHYQIFLVCGVPGRSPRMHGRAISRPGKFMLNAYKHNA